MSILADVTKAGLTVKIKDREVTLSPLTMRDIGEFERMIQFKPYYDLKALGADPAIINHALSDCMRHSVTVEEADEAAATPTGYIEQLYLSARAKHPDLTRDFFLGLSLPDLVAFNSQVKQISGLIAPVDETSEEDGEDGGDETKKKMMEPINTANLPPAGQ